MIRSRKAPLKVSPTGSSLVETPVPSSPLNPNSWFSARSRSSSSTAAAVNGDNLDLEESGNEGRRLFESRTISCRIRSFVRRMSKKELFFLACFYLASNLVVGGLVYSSMAMLSSPSSFVSSSCPKNMVEFGNWFSNTLDSKRKESFQDIRIDPSSKTQTKSFTLVPPQYYKTFYYDGKKISQPIARALRSRGWRRVDDTDNAHMIYTYNNNANWATDLQPWQRFNFIPDLQKWNGKAEFAYYYKKYEQSTGSEPSVYVPESYILTQTKREIEAFRRVLEQKNGNNHPWVHKLSNVNQGRGITILGPNSPELLSLPDKSLKDLEKLKQQSKKDSTSTSGDEEEEDEIEESIVQRYICNEMTWNHRKFDVRMYWFVASLDPLIVLYHDGYVRVGNSDYSEASFEDTTSHLTSHTGLGAETKATFAEFEEVLNQQHRANSVKPSSRSFPNNNSLKPVEHVRNQFKHALGEMIEIMRDESFVVPDYKARDPNMKSENAFQFYCADFILDKDLDVWFIEPQNGCGLDEDYYFRLEMHASLFNGMVDVLEEVGRKQEQSQPLLPFEKSGNWEIIYADGQVYNYDGYERSRNKEGCKVPTKAKTKTVIKISTH